MLVRVFKLRILVLLRIFILRIIISVLLKVFILRSILLLCSQIHASKFSKKISKSQTHRHSDVWLNTVDTTSRGFIICPSSRHCSAVIRKISSTKNLIPHPFQMRKSQLFPVQMRMPDAQTTLKAPSRQPDSKPMQSLPTRKSSGRRKTSTYTPSF